MFISICGFGVVPCISIKISFYNVIGVYRYIARVVFSPISCSNRKIFEVVFLYTYYVDKFTILTGSKLNLHCMHRIMIN